MRILQARVTLDTLQEMAKASFGDLVKAVVDVERELIAVDAELHSDLESLLLADGSSQNGLWGINFYPGIKGDDFLEFDSMINLRPSQGNLSRGVDDETTREKIMTIVNKWVTR